MRIVRVQKTEINKKDYIRRHAQESDYSTLIKDSCRIEDRETGEMIGVYIILPDTPSAVLRAITTMKYNKDIRTDGLATNSIIFGYRPRSVIRNDFCSSTATAKAYPKQHAIVCQYAEELSKLYAKHCPDVYDEHKIVAEEKILPEWRIPNSPFSSGIINKDNQLNYHLDAGNFAGMYSNMLAFKNHIKGGYLSMPEYDIGLEISNNSVTLFDGQKIVHGVTPIKKMSKTAYRYSVVYYTLKNMWRCEPIGEELARIKRVRGEKEKRRYDRLVENIPNEI